MQPQLKTPEDVMVRQALPKRTGLLKVKVGSQHQIKAKSRGQKGESVEVRDLGQYPEAKTVARCLSCKKDFKSEKELVAGHPTAREMKEDGETHVWGFWSDDRENPEDKSSPILGLLSDEELVRA